MNTEEITHLAKLSSLEVPENEIEALSEALESILQLANQLQSIDTDGIEPLFHPIEMITPLMQPLRPDQVTELNQREANMANAPAQFEGLFLVPKVID
jgi:aspartyl-tRNA(Asn)/glutamyl-tRNA(Gln) amidotransferase subunit C